MAEWERYVRAFRKDLDRWAVWEPGSPVDVYDYGVVDDGRWRKLGCLWERLERTERDVPKESGPTDIQFGSASVSAIDAGVNTPAMVGASVQLSFATQDACYVKAYKSTERSVSNLQDLAERLVTLEERWHNDWFLVVGVRTAARFSALASSKAGGEIKVTAPLAELQSFLLGTASASASLHISGTVGFSYIGESGPIHIDLVRIRRRWISGRAEVHGFDPERPVQVSLEEVKPSDVYEEDETDGR